MHTVEIHGVPRTAGGKTGARQLRAGGKIPAVIYGKAKSLPISIETREFDTILRKHGSGAFLLEMKIAGSEEMERLALLKEVQRDPASSRVLHVDFLQISMDQLIHVKIPLHLEGTPIGVKEGGVLDVMAREVEVECKAAEIPEDIKHDVTDLAFGNSIHYSDLVLPDGVRMLTSETRVVATVIAKVVIAEPTAAEAEAVPAEGTEGEEKKDAEGTEETKASS